MAQSNETSIHGGTVPNLITLQVIGGITLFLLLAWQLSTGLRWIKLGKKHYFYHRISGITIVTGAFFHMLNGLYIAGIIRL